MPYFTTIWGSVRNTPIDCRWDRIRRGAYYGFIDVHRVITVPQSALVENKCAFVHMKCLTVSYGQRIVDEVSMITGEKQMSIDTNKLYAQVARESWQDVNKVYRECFAETEDGGGSGGHFVEDNDLYLYVFADGTWTIDNPQYIQTTNGCISAVPIGLFNGPAELAEEIESNEDWDAIEDADDDSEDA